MKKNRIIFVTQDLAVGGGTSSLSSLYSLIKNHYNIKVILLSNIGEAKVSYKDCIIYPSFWVNNYYKDYGKSKGFEKLCIGIVKIIGKLYNSIGLVFEKSLVRSYFNTINSSDFVISFGEGAATTFCQHIKDKPKAAWIHYEVSKNPYSNKMEKLYSNFDKIVCVSDIIAEGFENIYPNLANKTIGIHNIIDVERIARMSKDHILEIFDNTKFNIICIGRLSYVKRFPEIPKIASELKGMGLKFQWRILGPECDESEKKRIIENIRKYNVADCVEWLGNKSNPYPYLAKSDLFVILSTTEACPMVITEARVLNVPIVSTDFCTSYEFINNDVDGLIRPLEQIANTIKTVLTDERLKNSLRQYSSKRVDNNKEAVRRFNSMIIGNEN